MIISNKDEAIFILAECIKNLSCMVPSEDPVRGVPGFLKEHLQSVYDHADSVARNYKP